MYVWVRSVAPCLAILPQSYGWQILSILDWDSPRAWRLEYPCVVVASLFSHHYCLFGQQLSLHIKSAKNAQVQNYPTLKCGTCYNDKYLVASKIYCYLKSWRPKKHLKQKWDKLWAICVIKRGGWDPIGPPLSC